MLAKILSSKSFLAHFILAVLFFLLLFLQISGKTFDGGDILGISVFIINFGTAYLFFVNSSFFKYVGFPFWYFLIWNMVFSEALFEYSFMIAFFFSNLMFWRLLVAERNPDNKNHAFEIGILLSFSAFFYPPSILLACFLVFNYIYMQSLNLRVMVLFLLGITLPFALGIQILYLLDETSWVMSFRSSFVLNFLEFNPFWLIPVGGLVLISWIDHLLHAPTQDINKRYSYFLSFMFFLNWIGILICFAGKDYHNLIVLGLPISIFLGRFTQFQNSVWTKESFLWFFLVFMLVFYFRIEIIEIYNELLGNVSF